MINILVTGSAGFIGFSLCNKLLKNNKIKIIGIDNINSYYSIKLKKKRVNILRKYRNFKFFKVDIIDKKKLDKIFKKFKFDIVFNLAAQAGVRYSYVNPESYCNSNILGFNNVINLVAKYKVKKLYFASSSSVYGDSKPFPKKENSKLNPLNIYSLSKVANEQVAFTFSKKIKTKIVGLRFFSIYGEWGRPDMLIIKYLISCFKKKSFELYNFGNHFRDFTYIKDAINLIIRLDKIKIKSNFEIFNICSSKPIKITKIINEINKQNIITGIIKKPLHKADVIKTYGDNSKIIKKIGKFKFTNYKEGVLNTLKWYLNYSKKF